MNGEKNIDSRSNRIKIKLTSGENVDTERKRTRNYQGREADMKMRASKREARNLSIKHNMGSRLSPFFVLTRLESLECLTLSVVLRGGRD